MHPTLAKLMTRAAAPLLAAAGAALLAGCAAAGKAPANTQYDFGSPAAPAGALGAIGAAGAAQAMPALVLTDVTGNAAFDNERMYYRLNYADPLQARAYANSRWSSTPLQMLTQRLKSRVAQAGIKVLSATDASTGVPLLRIDVDDFTHSFDSTTSSYGQLVLRASLFQGHTLLDQRTFSRKVDAASADAGGGARALAQATDAVAADMIAWLATKTPPARAQ
ncbi:MAG: ABC-type transport auxiliary lipoprotein family protein [Pseudomonadota bacterium]|nr:ABC-type transport auxiliary lipoprotein family protein [Pseudomonadota bacterium]